WRNRFFGKVLSSNELSGRVSWKFQLSLELSLKIFRDLDLAADFHAICRTAEAIAADCGMRL
ncbi:MAG: hypothetical protein WBQ95_14790, partial [Terracidiphilus sp.]